MTELVPPDSHPHSQSPLGHRLCASALALCFAMLSPRVALAAPEQSSEAAPPAANTEGAPPSAAAEPDAEGPTDEAPSVEAPSVAEVEAALADGDLSTAKELALARSEADPSPDNLELEAAVWEALGDYEQAKRAHAAALEALPEDDEARASIEAQLAELEAASRGTRVDEPESTHRERIDGERAERLAALAPKPPPPPEVIDEPTREPIIKKWYFWVTLGAIVASAGAIVGIAASTALDNDDSAAGASARRPVVPVGGAVFHF